jgi:hypothetical protein
MAINIKWNYVENSDTLILNISEQIPNEIIKVYENIYFEIKDNRVVGLEISNFNENIDGDKLYYYYGFINKIPVMRLCFGSGDVEWDIQKYISVGKKDEKIYYLEFPILLII